MHFHRGLVSHGKGQWNPGAVHPAADHRSVDEGVGADDTETDTQGARPFQVASTTTTTQERELTADQPAAMDQLRFRKRMSRLWMLSAGMMVKLSPQSASRVPARTVSISLPFLSRR